MADSGTFLVLAACLAWFSSRSQPTTHTVTSTVTSNAPKTTPKTGSSESADDRIAQYTEWLAGFTGLLVLISSVQILFLIRADKTARTSADAAKVLAEAAKIQSGEMEKASSLTEKQMLLAAEQADLAAKQHGLARLQFIVEKRPKLRVRNVVVRAAKRRGYEDTIFAPREFVSGQFYVANVGGTDARVREIYSEVFWPNIPLPMERPYEGKDGSQIDMTISPGQSQPFTFQSGVQLGERESDDILRGGNCQIYVMGWIEYEDIQMEALRRRTAFCRKYDPVRRRFYPVDDDDYENEE